MNLFGFVIPLLMTQLCFLIGEFFFSDHDLGLWKGEDEQDKVSGCITTDLPDDFFAEGTSTELLCAERGHSSKQGVNRTNYPQPTPL